MSNLKAEPALRLPLFIQLVSLLLSTRESAASQCSVVHNIHIPFEFRGMRHHQDCSFFRGSLFAMNKQKPITLPDLPLELLLMVAEDLSPVDFACLALCNRRLLSSLGSACRDLPKSRTGGPEDGPRIDFLTRFSRDLPQYHVCHACLRLHLWRKVALPGPKFKLAACVESLDGSVHRLKKPLYIIHYPSHAYYKFYFVHLQLAMRRFYHGAPFGIPVQSLLYTEVGVNRITYEALRPTKPHDEEEFQCSHMTTLLSVDARICSEPPGFYLRTQELAVVRQHNLSLLFPHPKNGSMHSCMHLGRISKLKAVVHELIDKYRSDTTTRPRDHGRCDKCNTSWQIEIRKMGQKDVCLVFTRWLDLGPGLSPDDNRWRCHNNYEFEIKLTDDEKTNSRQRFENDSMQANCSDALSEEEMYHRNMRFIQGQAYRTLMTRFGACSWYLHGEKELDQSRCAVS